MNYINSISLRIKLILTLLVSLYILDSSMVYAQAQEDYTRIIIFRHAPKLDIGNIDPALSSDLGLNEEGIRRAEGLAELAEHYKISEIYSTNLKRTKETVVPLAKASKLNINTSVKPFDYQGQIDSILKNKLGETVVIVGHSNTVPGFINHLKPDENLPNLAHDAYDDVFILKYFNESKVELVKMVYQVKTTVNHSLFIKD